MDQDSVLKVLVVGLGSIGQRHIRNLRALLGERVDLLAYRTRDSQVVLSDRMQVESEFGLHSKYGIRPYTDLDVALAARPDAVLICNPNSLHIPPALAAARAGCHLFIEKPLSDNLEGVPELLQLVQKNNLVALVGYQLRFHPCVKTVRQLLQEQRIGRLIAGRVVDGEYLPGWHPYEDYRQSYAAHRELGGGTILARIHEMDYLYSFFGVPRRVFTLGGHLSSLEIDVEDVASTLFEFRSGDHTFPVHLHQDIVQRPPSRSCEIIGDAGKIEMDLLRSRVRVYDREGKPGDDYDFSTVPRNQLFLDEMSHFLSCLRGEALPFVTLQDGMQSLRMALAAKESMDGGQVVQIPPV